jgi:hypothetical protein
VKLVFKLEQTGTQDWEFLATKNSDDDFYGITMSSDTDSEFHDASREASDKVSVQDRNNDNKTYSYTITLQNKLTGDTWHYDPSIENRSDG